MYPVVEFPKAIYCSEDASDWEAINASIWVFHYTFNYKLLKLLMTDSYTCSLKRCNRILDGRDSRRCFNEFECVICCGVQGVPCFVSYPVLGLRGPTSNLRVSPNAPMLFINLHFRMSFMDNPFR